MKLTKEAKKALASDKLLRAKLLTELRLKTDINIDRWVKTDFHRLLSLPVLTLIADHLKKNVQELITK